MTVYQNPKHAYCEYNTTGDKIKTIVLFILRESCFTQIMTDQNVSYHDLPNVPEEAIIAITSNEPTPEDPLHVRHLKRIAVRSVQVSIK